VSEEFCLGGVFKCLQKAATRSAIFLDVRIGVNGQDDETGILEGFAEILLAGFSFVGDGVDRDQVIGVKIDPIRADLAEQVDQFGGGFVFAHCRTKWGTAA
jgi:hypothetical protein